jgi:hypothetical protein
MIKKHSDDPDVEQAAAQTLEIVKEVLDNLHSPHTYDYGGHILKVGEYDVCVTCTKPIAEAQHAAKALLQKAQTIEDGTIKEHLELAAKLFQVEADAAIIRAEFHNGLGTESILNELLGYQYNHKIHDEYDHSHRNGN